MAEEYDRKALEEEIEREAAELARAAAEQAAPVAEAAEQVEEPVAEAVAEATQVFEAPIEVGDAMPTQTIDPATEAIPVQVEGTTPMPNPFPEPQATTPFPEPPAVTTEGYDVAAVDVIPDTPAPGEVRDPYAPATAAAAVGAAAAASAIPQATTVPPQPVEPWRQAGFEQGAYTEQPRPTYAQSQQTYAQPQATYAQPGYQNAVQHQPFAPDPTVNPYEYSLTELSGGLKFGWLLIGFFLNIPGMLLAWLVNADKHPQVKHDAIMWSVIGFVISIVLVLISSVVFAGIIAAAVSSYSGYSGYYF